MLSKIPPHFSQKLGYAALAVIFSFASSCAGFASPPVLARSAGCDAVRFIFARGSGEPLNGPSMSAWRDEITAAIGPSAANFHYSFYELGSAPQRGHQYPAVSVSDNLNGYINLVGAYFSGGEAFRFGASVEEGIKELLAYVGDVAAACPRTKFVLGGYSQGAMVLSASLPALDANKIIFAATFGDPKLYLPEGNPTLFGPLPKLPDACRGLNLSPYRISVPDCRAYEGILGSYRPYQPAAYAGKLGTWCNEKDIMCSSGASISDHTSYASSNLYRDAATLIAKKLAAAFPDYHLWPASLRSAKHNVAFVIDTTVSMASVLDQYRAEAKALAARVFSEGGNVALVEYRDLWDGYAPQTRCDFSCDLEEFNRRIDQLEIGGGGDFPESALSAMLHTMNALDWQAGATKSIILLTDDRFHNPDYDGTTIQKVAQRSLEIDPVNIFAVVPVDTRGIDSYYRKLTAATAGEVFILGRVDLASTTDTILSRPVARLSLSRYVGQVDDEFVFDASASYSGDDGALIFDWDLDGDGQFELTHSEPIIRHVYPAASEHFIQVRVTDASGKSSTMSASVSVSASAPTPATISALEVDAQPGGVFAVRFRTDGAKALLATDDLVRGFVEVKNGSGYFLLQDVPDPLTLTLTPYSTSNDRGVSRSIQIPASIPSNDDSPSNNDNPASAPTLDVKPTPADPEKDPGNGPEKNSATPSAPLFTPSTLVPKAPNSGTVNQQSHQNPQNQQPRQRRHESQKLRHDPASTL